MTEHKVRIFSTTSCPWCIKVKQYLEEHKIEFEEINVQEDQEAAKEMVEKSGQTGVPVLEIDGQMVIGFDKEKIDELLGIKG
ncbi:MAG: glutaredoxin domain-containing protein [Candidatus Aenigmarchaeota archaeon]